MSDLSPAALLVDSSGNIVGVVLDGSIYRVQTEAKLVEGIADNAGFTDGTSRVVPAGLIFDETAGAALTENDVGAARMDSKRAAVFALEDHTTRGRRATVKAASTAPAAADPAIIVGVNPTSTVSIGPKDDLDSERIFATTAHVSMATAGADNPLVLFRNPASSGKTAYVLSVRGGCAVANVSAVFGLYSTPTVTATGSALTAAQRRVGGSTAAVVTPFSGPTVSSNGTEQANAVQGQNATSQELVHQHYVIAVPEGSDLLVTGRPGSNNRQAEITIVWVEK